MHRALGRSEMEKKEEIIRELERELAKRFSEKVPI
jgi:hypothetical protein